MSEISLQLFQGIRTWGIKTCVIIVAVLTCTSFYMTVGWKGVPTVPSIRTSAARGDGNNSTTGDHRSLATPSIQSVTSVERSCSMVSNMKVLAKPLDRCATYKSVKMVEEEDIYVSIKTTSRNHASRMLPVLLTWLQTLRPKRVRSARFLCALIIIVR